MDVNEAIGKLKELDGQSLPETEVPVNEEETKKDLSGKSFYARLRDGEVTVDDIPDEIRQEWVRSILGDIPFAYTVSILGGRVGFVFSELDAERSSLYRKISKAAGTDLDTQTRLCIVLFLREITGDVPVKLDKSSIETDPTAIHTPNVSIDKAYDELCSKMPAGLSKLLFGAWNIYSTLVGLMTQDAFPDSF